MIKIFKYLKPYIVFIIMCSLLLFLQANMELALPGYMSKIVNIGLQQSGIEEAVPEVIRVSEVETLKNSLSNESVRIFSENYSVKDMNNFSVYEINNDADFDKALFASDLSKAYLGRRGVTDFGTIDDSIILQAGIYAITMEYKFLGVDLNKKQSSYILKTGFIMIIFTLISAFATIFSGYFASKTATGLSRNLRTMVFEKVENFSGVEFDKFSTASLITRSTNDITQIQTVIYMMMKMVLYAPIIGIGGVVKAVRSAPSMAWIIGLALLVLLALIVTVMKVALPKFQLIQKLVDKLNLVSRERLTGLLVIRAFNRQDSENRRFDKTNTELTSTNLFVNRVMVVMMPMMMLIMNVVSVAIIWVGAKEVAASTMMIGDMMAFMQYSMQIIMAFFMLSSIFIFIPRGTISANRITEVLETELTIIDPVKPLKLSGEKRGTIEFKNVSFKYPGADENVINNIDFIAEPGKTTAIIGSTGSGKSTLINLIPRFYDVTSGEILIDGVNIKDIKQKELRDNLGYVPQRTTLFSGTIETNLKYADSDADRERLVKAAEYAQAMEFINTKDGGFDAEISQGGVNISGGQKQRLSIARSFVKEFPVYLFDDTFSALDLKTDAKIRKNLKEKTSNSTVIIIAQRVSTIMGADQIIVLDQGRIVGKGSHKELYESCIEYREIALSQLEVEELA